MRHFALLLATLALAACETNSTAQFEGTLPLVGAELEMESSISDNLQIHDPEQEVELLDRLDDVLSRNDIDPGNRAALAEIAALLRKTN